jgi:hypothetical protein
MSNIDIGIDIIDDNFEVSISTILSMAVEVSKAVSTIFSGLFRYIDVDTFELI